MDSKQPFAPETNCQTRLWAGRLGTWRAGNSARSRLLARLKGGCGQEWPPYIRPLMPASNEIWCCSRMFPVARSSAARAFT